MRAASTPFVLLAVFTVCTLAWLPSECPQDCVRPFDWWAVHRPGAGYYWPSNSEWNHFACGATWIEVVTSQATDSWTQLAQQYVTAKLNLLDFNCIETLPGNISQTLSDTQNLLGGDNCSVSDEPLAQELLQHITDFNNGNDVVATCLCPIQETCPPQNQCPTCSPCNTPQLQCTPDITQQCCIQQSTAPPVTTATPTTMAPLHTTTAPPTTTNCGVCTRTQGYWKTHPEAWGSVSLSVCGVSAMTILQTSSSGGDAFIILARQYIAATLNKEVLNVCLDSVVGPAYLAAGALLGSACEGPTGYTAPTGSVRDQFVAIATVLDNFNNGLLGPGHCEGDTTDETDIVQYYLNALRKSYAADEKASSAAALVPMALSVIAVIVLTAM